MSSLTTFMRPALSRPSFSTTGLTIRHGPHHGAQKSTSTGTDARISSSKEPLSASTIHGRSVWQTAHRGTPSARGRRRFFLPQFGQVTVVAATDTWVGPLRAPSTSGDLDVPRLCLLRLRDPDRQDAAVELRVDLLGVGLAGQVDAELELAHAPRAAPQDARALALLDLAPHHELGVVHLDVDVLLVDARQLGLDDPCVVGLLDVDRRDPRRALPRRAGERALQQLAHLRLQLVELAERLEAPYGAGGHVASAGR